LNYAGGIFCARQNKKKFGQIYARFTGQQGSCHQLAFDKKRPNHGQVHGRRY
jgi:hypothetical protein